MAQVLECLPSKNKALNSNPTIAQKDKSFIKVILYYFFLFLLFLVNVVKLNFLLGCRSMNFNTFYMLPL
jgi:hypothetical protein